MEKSLVLKQFRRLLLVDDEPSVLFALRLLLNALGFEVKEFQTPTDALSYLESNSKDVEIILSDLKMPKVDGIEFLQELRSQGCSLPFVLMSAHATPDDVNKALTLGANGFLAKPFTPDDLFSLLGEIIESTQTLHPSFVESDLRK